MKKNAINMTYVTKQYTKELGRNTCDWDRTFDPEMSWRIITQHFLSRDSEMRFSRYEIYISWEVECNVANPSHATGINVSWNDLWRLTSTPDHTPPVFIWKYVRRLTTNDNESLCDYWSIENWTEYLCSNREEKEKRENVSFLKNYIKLFCK